MTDSTFSQAIKRLELAFAKGKPSKDQIKLYWEKLQGYSDESLKLAVENFIDNDNQGFFPNIGTLRTLTAHFEEKLRSEEHEQIKKEEREAAKKFFQGDAKGSELAKRSLLLIRVAMEGKITRSKYIEGMQALGFNQEAAKLSKHFEYEGLPIDKEFGSELYRRVTA